MLHSVSRAKRHHVVAESFLYRFADTKGRVAVVGRDDPSDQFTTGVKNALVEGRFYDSPLPGAPDPLWVETGLSRIEGEAKAALGRIDEGTFPPTDADRRTLMRFIALGLIRGYRFRELVEPAYAAWKTLPVPTHAAMAENARLLLGVEPSGNELDVLVEEVRRAKETNEPLPEGAAAGLIALLAGAVSEHLAGRTWHLLTFDEPLLVTGDAPVALNNNVLSRSCPLGILNCDEILIPIDPRRAVFLLKSGRAAPRQSGTPELARRVNHTIASQCLRWIVHKPDTMPPLDFTALGRAEDTRADPSAFPAGP